MRSRTIYLWALINFTLTAIIGLSLRMFSVGLVTGFHYKHWLHAHSHLAFLGWIYPAIIAYMADLLPIREQEHDPRIKYLFLCMQVAVFSLLFTFPRFGYGWPSIVALSVHMAASIWLVFYIIQKLPDQLAVAKSYLKAGAWMMVVSGMGALALGPVAVLGLKYTPWYNGSIYFYLHFQYNGWFSLALLGIAISMVRSGNEREYRLLRRGLNLLILSIMITYALSLLGFGVPWWVYTAGSAGGLLQILAFLMISGILIGKKTQIFEGINGIYQWIVKAAFHFLWLKILIQLASSIPAIAEQTYRSRDLVIAYLHFFLLGTVSAGLLGLAVKKNWIDPSMKSSRSGISLLFAGFLITEAVLVARGLTPTLRMAHDHFILIIGAGLMLVGVILLTGSTMTGTVRGRNN